MTSSVESLEDDEIRLVVRRLARPHPSGGQVIERATILAEGIKSAAILAWIAEHSWEPEETAPATSGRGGGGLHSARREGGRADAGTPRRYVLRPDAPG